MVTWCLSPKDHNGQSVPVPEKPRKTRKEKKMEDYTFEKMWEDLRNGYQIYYTYVGNRYLLFKTAENCYTQKLLSDHKKNPQPKMLMLTLKRVKEMFPDMEDIEYKIGT
jgi:hypothetical protein